jgi:hypothetical protein
VVDIIVFFSGLGMDNHGVGCCQFSSDRPQPSESQVKRTRPKNIPIRLDWYESTTRRPYQKINDACIPLTNELGKGDILISQAASCVRPDRDTNKAAATTAAVVASYHLLFPARSAPYSAWPMPP